MVSAWMECYEHLRCMITNIRRASGDARVVSVIEVMSVVEVQVLWFGPQLERPKRLAVNDGGVIVTSIQLW